MANNLTTTKKLEAGDVLVHMMYNRIITPCFFCVTSVSPSGKTFQVRELQRHVTRDTDGGYGQAGYCVASNNFWKGGAAIDGRVNSKSGRYQIKMNGYEYRGASIYNGEELEFDFRD